jgi:hypothetical protein
VCESEDCAFRVLDARPDLDLDRRLRACRDRTGRLAYDCAQHTMQAWAVRHPDAEAVARAVALDTPWPDVVASWIGRAIACGGEGSCAVLGPRATLCETGERQVRADPGWCRVPPLALPPGPP